MEAAESSSRSLIRSPGSSGHKMWVLGGGPKVQWPNADMGAVNVYKSLWGIGHKALEFPENPRKTPKNPKIPEKWPFLAHFGPISRKPRKKALFTPFLAFFRNYGGITYF